MIERYSDHAANERTFLAWVRTGIAVMAFGFLVERFDLLLEIASQSLAGRTLSAYRKVTGDGVGLALILLGGAMVVLAATRFRRTAKVIDDENARPGAGARMDLALMGLLVLAGAALAIYLLYMVIGRF